MRLSSFLLAALLCLSATARAEDVDIAAAFNRAGMDGTMVITSLGTGRTFSHNDARAATRFPVASTFKILNSLIALEEKAVTPDEVLKWNGHTYDITDWNRDQTLASAFKVSCVWCYQELASRIGNKTYRRYLSKLDYGQLKQPFNTTTFWLDGSLQVSAQDQIRLLRRIYLRSLPFSDASYNTLRQIMLVEQAPTYTLRAKTGWASSATPQTGWYVGYVQTADDVWFFATNLVIHDVKELPLRLSLSREALQLKGILPKPE
ncbi:beta-lactamase class D [Fluviicoccus keumensis]|uniref:beta-lactamase n=1 Tax=Fluviicoccus keumensis TaxID=1435465 RepID=A0A4Q7Z6G2_9GAMM|nr:class D beta-lactamase [Fluviicoccus keumensis]RZU45333.1 beta-lactamase class D [Fluviicoccus keumensis]